MLEHHGAVTEFLDQAVLALDGCGETSAQRSFSGAKRKQHKKKRIKLTSIGYFCHFIAVETVPFFFLKWLASLADSRFPKVRIKAYHVWPARALANYRNGGEK